MKSLIRCLAVLLLLNYTAPGIGQESGVKPAEDDSLRFILALDDYPHAERVSLNDEQVVDHEVGLGAVKKVRGVWQFRNSERLSGRLIRYTWQIVDGFSSAEVMRELLQRVQESGFAEQLFVCEGRACGKSAQWANRVFQQRILYGREDQQAYAAYSLGEEGNDRLMVYSAVRTADRQYLHVELLMGHGSD